MCCGSSFCAGSVSEDRIRDQKRYNVERIQKALELARASRQARKGNAQSGQASRSDSSPNQDGLRVVYTQTQRYEPLVSELRDKRLVIGEESTPHTDAYKMLRTQVLQRLRANGWNSLAIVSPNGGAGKSLTAANLAISLAREVRHTVLLVDVNLRQPALHELFGYPAAAGLSEYLTQDIALGSLLFSPGIERLVVLPGGAPVTNSSEMLSSPRMKRLVTELKTRYPERIVLFDLPAALAGDDVLAFSPHVEACLFVTEEGRTNRDDLERTVDLLHAIPNLGVVLNKSMSSRGKSV